MVRLYSGTAPTSRSRPVGACGQRRSATRPARPSGWATSSVPSPTTAGHQSSEGWLPRLLPGMGVALFHGASVRCAHAVHAIETADTPARRAELVRALGYWAALFDHGSPPDLDAVRDVDDPGLAVVHSATDAARRYLARPNIICLHGVTAAMAVAILLRHTDTTTAATALAHVKAEHAALYLRTDPVRDVAAPDVDEATLIDAAIVSGEAHTVKLVEASLRGFAVTSDPAFLAAAQSVPPDAASARSPRHSTWTAGDLDPPATPAPTSRTAIGHRPRRVNRVEASREDAMGDCADGLD